MEAANSVTRLPRAEINVIDVAVQIKVARQGDQWDRRHAGHQVGVHERGAVDKRLGRVHAPADQFRFVDPCQNERVHTVRVERREVERLAGRERVRLPQVVELELAVPLRQGGGDLKAFEGVGALLDLEVIAEGDFGLGVGSLHIAQATRLDWERGC